MALGVRHEHAWLVTKTKPGGQEDGDNFPVIRLPVAVRAA